MKQAWSRIRGAVAEQAELQERLALLNRPWAEEYLHWSPVDGTLHGHLMPPTGWRRYSVTRGGWCQHGRLLPYLDENPGEENPGDDSCDDSCGE